MLQGGPALTALVPLRLGPLVASGRPGIRVQEAGWYQVFDTPGLEITLLPAMHWNRRGLRDFNKALWGSFLIRWKGKSIYFAGDTGYQTHFKEVPELVGPVDIALLPIGAYDPPFIMRPSHLDPEEALQAFVDLKARRLVPMHYGTFDLSDEPLGEPLQRLRAAAAGWGLEASLRPLAVGEVLFLD
jgi:L-ascorbate metabolism protein UlaG (beta-lactamase superfamily)